MILKYNTYKRDIEYIRKYLEGTLRSSNNGIYGIFPSKLYDDSLIEKNNLYVKSEFYVGYPETINIKAKIGFNMNMKDVKINTLLTKDKEKCYLFLDTRSIPAKINLNPMGQFSNRHSTYDLYLFDLDNTLKPFFENAIYYRDFNLSSDMDSADSNTTEKDLILSKLFGYSEDRLGQYVDLSASELDSLYFMIKYNNSYSSLDSKDKDLLDKAFGYSNSYRELSSMIGAFYEGQDCTLSCEVSKPIINKFVLPFVEIDFNLDHEKIPGKDKARKMKKEDIEKPHFPIVRVLNILNPARDLDFIDVQDIFSENGGIDNRTLKKIFSGMTTWDDYSNKLDLLTLKRLK